MVLAAAQAQVMFRRATRDRNELERFGTASRGGLAKLLGHELRGKAGDRPTGRVGRLESADLAAPIRRE